MKDFDKIDTPETDRQVVEIPVPTKRVKMGHTPMFRGQIMWEINMQTLECVPAQFKRSMVDPKVDLGTSGLIGDDLRADVIHHQCIYKDGFFYSIAINKKNALRKYQKLVTLSKHQ